MVPLGSGIDPRHERYLTQEAPDPSKSVHCTFPEPIFSRRSFPLFPLKYVGTCLTHFGETPVKALFFVQLCILWLVALGSLGISAAALSVVLHEPSADRVRQPQAVTTEKAPPPVMPKAAAE
jgi:hypothetical protein